MEEISTKKGLGTQHLISLLTTHSSLINFSTRETRLRSRSCPVCSVIGCTHPPLLPRCRMRSSFYGFPHRVRYCPTTDCFVLSSQTAPVSLRKLCPLLHHGLRPFLLGGLRLSVLEDCLHLPSQTAPVLFTNRANLSSRIALCAHLSANCGHLSFTECACLFS